MPKNNYFIVVSTDPDSDTSIFWDVSIWGWTQEEMEATHFDRNILVAPLPEGTGLVIECDSNGNYINSFAPIDLPYIGRP